MRKKAGYLYCFSPGVMLATFIIEVLFAIILFVRSRYKPTFATLLTIAILIFLAAFQAIEYLICMPFGYRLLLARIGFFSITLLPPLGIHLAYTLAHKSTHPHVFVPYLTAFIMNVLFLLSPLTVQNVACQGNYVIFELPFILNIVYAFYYQGFLLFGLMTAFHLSHEVKESRAQRLRWLGFGYAVFMLPTAIVVLLRPETLHAIPSIMCGFALILACILFMKVALPRKSRK